MSDRVGLSVVVPAYNEEDNIEPLVHEVEGVFDALDRPAELVIVDDGSTDGVCARVEALMQDRPWLRLIRMTRNTGQSAAFHAGIRAARAPLVGMLDADLQNDPRDLPGMIATLESVSADWVQGVRRRRSDKDGLKRKFSSWVGRSFRRMMLGDTIQDTGCSCRVFRREVGLQLPLQFRGLHRFMPVYARKLGYLVVEADVRHRPRHAGTAKYGTFDRAMQGLRDLFAVRWMFNRLRPVAFTEVARPARVETTARPAREATHVEA